jgi:hypothetical protein
VLKVFLDILVHISLNQLKLVIKVKLPVQNFHGPVKQSRLGFHQALKSKPE